MNCHQSDPSDPHTAREAGAPEKNQQPIAYEQVILHSAIISQKQFSADNAGIHPTLDIATVQCVENFILNRCDAKDRLVDNIIGQPVMCKISLKKQHVNFGLSDKQMSQIDSVLLRFRNTTSNAVQFYLAPGVNHCGIDRLKDPTTVLDIVNLRRVDAHDVLHKMEIWIETGQAPTQLKAIS